MVNIGIYLAAEPFGGGTYQYNLSVIGALASLDKDKYKITAFFFNKDWIRLLPKSFTQVTAGNSIVLRAISRAYNIMDNSLDSSRKFAHIFNPLVKKINVSDCDVVIFPSQDAASYQTIKKSISTIHDLMHRYESHFEEYQNGEFDRRENHYSLMCEYADGILVDSEIGKQHVIDSYGYDGGKVFILPFVPPLYLLDKKEIDIKEKYNLPERYVFYPAQFWEHKNHINLLKAMEILKTEYSSDVKLVLVGSKKNNYKEVCSKISELGLLEDVFILGYVSNDDMAALYKNSLATTFVSLIGPTNIPPMEALTLGSPLICSNAYGMPKQVDGAALLIDPKDPKDIANKISMIASDVDVAIRCIDRGYQVIHKYSQEDFNKKLEEIITGDSRPIQKM